MAGFGHHVVHVFLHGFHFGEHSILDVHATAQQISGHRLQVKLALAHRHRADCTKRQAAKENRPYFMFSFMSFSFDVEFHYQLKVKKEAYKAMQIL